MTIKSKRLIVVLAVTAAVALAALIVWPRKIVEYATGADGVVTDPQGKPIAGATVRLRFDERVFDAITPVREAQLQTDDQGRFGDFFISCGKPGGPYLVIVEKPGFVTSRVRGTGTGHHRIVLQPVKDAARSPVSSTAV